MLNRMKTWFMHKQEQRQTKAPEFSKPIRAGDVFHDPMALVENDVYVMFGGEYYRIVHYQIFKDWRILVDFRTDLGLSSARLLPTDPVWVVKKG